MDGGQQIELPKRLPLVIEPENRNDLATKDARLINGFMEKIDGTKEYRLYKRPGLASYFSTSAAAGLGTYNWLGDVYAVFGSKFYRNGVEVGSGMDTTGGIYRFDQCLGTPQLQLSNGVGAFNYTVGGGLAAITGLNFPTAPFPKGWAYLDGTTYVMDFDANIHGCDTLNDPTAWADVLNVIQAQIEPDRGRALTKQLVYVVALKEWSSEVFYDQQNATDSPLGPVQGAKFSYGCAAADSVQRIDDTLFWVSTNRDASVQVVMVNNLKLEIVSSKAIDRLLEKADLSVVRSFTFKIGGHKFYILTVPSINLTLVYDSVEKMWAQWTDAAGNYFPIVASTFSAADGHIVQHGTNGKLYKMSTQYFNDAGVVITTDIYTPNFDGGTTRGKMLSNMWAIGDQTAGSVLKVRTNDEDYSPTAWTGWREFDMSQRRPNIDDCGTFLRRAWNIRHDSNTHMRLEGVELQLDLCTL